MKKSDSVLGKSLIQTAIGLFIFAVILFLLWLITLLLEKIVNINLPINREDLNLVLIIASTIGTAIYIYNSSTLRKEKEDIKKQIDLLRILYIELSFLEKSLESYKETFSKKSHYPFYELWNIDTSIYFNGLSHKINNQETIALKENLMIIKDKLLIINNMKLESKKLEEERGKEKIIGYAIKILREKIIKIIDADILPIIKKSKEFLDNFLLK